jgi:hypothetical protein
LKIYEFKKSFASDRSSSSYEFLAVDKPLTKSGIAAVSRFTDIAPTPRRATMSHDFPGGWEKLITDYYDIMYLNSKGRYVFAIAFEASDAQRFELKSYLFDSGNDEGISMALRGSRTILIIKCRLAPDYFVDEDDFEDPDYREEEVNDGYDDVEDDETEDKIDKEDKFEKFEDKFDNASVDGYDDVPDDFLEEAPLTKNTLLRLLCELREQLVNGDCSSLYSFWETYADEDDPDLVWPPFPDQPPMANLVSLELAGMLDFLG